MMYELKLDFFDGTKLIRLTRHNIDLINFACRTVDSSYRNQFNLGFKDSSGWLIDDYCGKLGNWAKNRDAVNKICTAIDRENSTHLSVSGTVSSKNEDEKNKNENTTGKNKDAKSQNENAQGINQMTNCIVGYEGILEEIKKGKHKVVEILAQAVKGRTTRKGVLVDGVTFSKFSFASKFCTYVSRYQFGNDNNYSIYDAVVQAILPYYLYKYVDEKTAIDNIKENIKKKTKESTVSNYKEKNNYDGYNKLIECAIAGVKEKEDDQDKMTKTDFDLLLWYYYKGEKDGLIQEALNSIPLN